jgi:hypothetical protein
MGNQPTKAPKLDKFTFEITLDKIIQHLTLFRNRKVNSLAEQEIKIRETCKESNCSYSSIEFELGSVVSVLKTIKATNLIIKYAKILK